MRSGRDGPNRVHSATNQTAETWTGWRERYLTLRSYLGVNGISSPHPFGINEHYGLDHGDMELRIIDTIPSFDFAIQSPLYTRCVSAFSALQPTLAC